METIKLIIGIILLVGSMAYISWDTAREQRAQKERGEWWR